MRNVFNDIRRRMRTYGLRVVAPVNLERRMTTWFYLDGELQ